MVAACLGGIVMAIWFQILVRWIRGCSVWLIVHSERERKMCGWLGGIVMTLWLLGMVIVMSLEKGSNIDLLFIYLEFGCHNTPEPTTRI